MGKKFCFIFLKATKIEIWLQVCRRLPAEPRLRLVSSGKRRGTTEEETLQKLPGSSQLFVRVRLDIASQFVREHPKDDNSKFEQDFEISFHRLLFQMVEVPGNCSSDKFKVSRKAQLHQWLSSKRCHEKDQLEATPSKLVPSSKAGKRSDTKSTAKTENEAAPKKRKISIIPS